MLRERACASGANQGVRPMVRGILFRTVTPMARIGVVAAGSQVGPPSSGAGGTGGIARPAQSLAPAWLCVFLVVRVVRAEQNQPARAPDHQYDECETEEQIELRLLQFEGYRSEEHTSELQSRQYLVCRLLLEKKTK